MSASSHRPDSNHEDDYDVLSNHGRRNRRPSDAETIFESPFETNAVAACPEETQKIDGIQLDDDSLAAEESTREGFTPEFTISISGI